MLLLDELGRISYCMASAAWRASLLDGWTSSHNHLNKYHNCCGYRRFHRWQGLSTSFKSNFLSIAFPVSCNIPFKISKSFIPSSTLAYKSCLCCCTQALGRTPLNEVSPKKTLEGAAVGLSASVAVAVLLARLLQWPTSIPRYYLSWMQ